MIESDDLGRWIGTLRARLARGDLAGSGSIDLGDGTGHLPGELFVRIMLADLDHLDGLPPEAREWVDFPDRRQALLNDFKRLRELLG
jgi:hypothetical protein